MRKEQMTLVTEIAGSDDGKLTYEIMRRWSDTGKKAVVIELYHVVTELLERIVLTGFEGCTLTLKVKFDDFKQVTRSLTSPKAIKRKDDILPLAKQLMSQIEYSSQHAIRLIGLSVSNPPAREKHGEWVEGWLEF